jgi:hypothetical protein
VQDISEIGFKEMFWPFTLPDWLPLPGKATKRRAMRQLKSLLLHHMAQPDAAQGSTLLAMLRALRDAGDAAGDGPVTGQGQGLDEQEVFDQCMVSFTRPRNHGHGAAVVERAAGAPPPAARATQEVDSVLQGREPGPTTGLPCPGWCHVEGGHAPLPAIAALMTRRTTRPIAGSHTLPARALVRDACVIPHARFFPEPGPFAPSVSCRCRAATAAPMPFGPGPRAWASTLRCWNDADCRHAAAAHRIAATDAPMPEPRLNVTLRIHPAAALAQALSSGGCHAFFKAPESSASGPPGSSPPPRR